MPTLTLTLAGANQFAGGIGTGLFTWPTSRLPRTTRINLISIAYHGAVGDTCDRLDFVLIDPAGPATARMLIGRGVAPVIVGPDNDVDFTICGRPVPRNADGTHWTLAIFSFNKSQDATVTVDYSLIPMPDTDPGDGRP